MRGEYRREHEEERELRVKEGRGKMKGLYTNIEN